MPLSASRTLRTPRPDPGNRSMNEPPGEPVSRTTEDPPGPPEPASQGRSLLSFLRGLFHPSCDTVLPVPDKRLRLSGRGLRIPGNDMSFELEMGPERLEIHPITPVDGSPLRHPPEYVLFNSAHARAGICHHLFLQPGQRLSFSHQVTEHSYLFDQPRSAFRRHFQIHHEGNALVFRDPISEVGTYLRPLPNAEGTGRFLEQRRHSLTQVREAFGGPIEQLSPQAALATLREVNALLKREPFRDRDSLGNPGALLELPPGPTPILVGDLHGRVENLVTILGANGFIDSLVRGDGLMLLLGDAVHLEEDGKLEEMESSVLIMDLILRLKLRFPDRFFFMTGNHDSFSPDVMKGGVPQSVLWSEHLRKLRGEEYRNELDLFYRLSPLLALSGDFIACHAAPPRVRVSREMLVDLRQHPELVHQVTSSRVETRGLPGGYSKGDVRRFRRHLELAEDTPFIVGHFPRSQDGTIWLDVEKIPDHHIVYSAKTDRVGVFTRVNGELLPQTYPVTSALDWLNRPARS